MLCALHTHYPWSLDLFIHVPFQLIQHTTLRFISALGTSRTHCHLCPTRYWFPPESSEACEGNVPFPATQHRNNVPIMRGERHDISLKILHQAGFETARQAVTLAKLCALAITPRPSLCVFEHRDLQMFGPKLNKYGLLSATWNCGSR